MTTDGFVEREDDLGRMQSFLIRQRWLAAILHAVQDILDHPANKLIDNYNVKLIGMSGSGDTLAVQPISAAFARIDKSLLEASAMVIAVMACGALVWAGWARDSGDFSERRERVLVHVLNKLD